MNAPHVAFIGTQGAFSRAALQTLLDNGLRPSLLLLASERPAPQPANPIPVAAQGDALQQLARQHNIPVQYLDRSLRHSPEWPRFSPPAPAPDYLLMACFPYRLPPTLTQWPRRACLNLHPSLLPAYRGPDPLFWQLRRGESHTGISLHHVSQTLDAGDIVAQQAVPLPDGASREQLDTLLATRGAALFCQLLTTAELPAAKAQAVDAGHYQPLPQAADYALSRHWSAQRAFNFIRACSRPGQAFSLAIDAQHYQLLQAIDYQATAALDAPCQYRGGEWWIQFSPGVLRAKAR
jgi:methionyl-tRNA formyltransferase